MLRVVNRGVDLIKRVSMRDEVVQLELAFAVLAKFHFGMSRSFARLSIKAEPTDTTVGFSSSTNKN